MSTAISSIVMYDHRYVPTKMCDYWIDGQIHRQTPAKMITMSHSAKLRRHENVSKYKDFQKDSVFLVSYIHVSGL